jgi:uncharacterized protein (TIGR03435 family)
MSTTTVRPCIVAIAMASAAVAIAQTADGAVQVDAVRFDAASVRPNRDSTQQSMRRLPGGRFTATAATVHSLLLGAYGVQRYELAGGPSWMATDRFDIVASLGAEPPPAAPGVPDRVSLALRTLLAERFRLVVHREPRQTDVYHLVTAESGTPGPGLRRSTGDCAPSCGGRQGFGRLEGRGMTIASLAPTLAGHVRRLVVDRTGLQGTWDVELRFAPDGATDTSAPSIFTALREQLGLKLEPARDAVEMLVVDRLEHPTAD